jgi:hypothetical protein
MKLSTILILAAAGGGGYLLLQRQKAKAAAAPANQPRTYAAASAVTLPEPAGTAARYDKSGKLAMGSISGNLFTGNRATRGLGSLG